MRVRVGIDLDNTIVGYDGVFAALAIEHGVDLSGAGTDKRSIRDAVRAHAGNEVWTAIQGLAYGPRMKDAAAMAGVKEFFAWASGQGIELFIVSHKTRRSAIGNHDLHGPAAEWLKTQGFLTANRGGLVMGQSIFLEETLERKLARATSLSLTHFIDDLEEVLTDPNFPSGVERLHYAPGGEKSREPGMTSFKSWTDIQKYLGRIVSTEPT